MLKVEIDRQWWSRGDGTSLLLDTRDGGMCCMGFAALEAGFDPQTIADKGTVEQLPACGMTPDPLTAFYNTAEGSSIYSVNDTVTFDDETREEQLIKLGLTVNIEFSFVN